MAKKILEYMWFVISLVALITSIDAYMKQGLAKDSILFFGVAVLAYFMYYLRKKQRTRNSK